MEWFPMYATKFDSATRGWSAEAKGCYVTLLNLQWLQGGVPESPDRLATICAPVADWPASWAELESKFPVNGDGCRKNPVLERIRAEQTEKSLRRKVAGKSGGAAKARRRKHC